MQQDQLVLRPLVAALFALGLSACGGGSDGPSGSGGGNGGGNGDGSGGSGVGGATGDGSGMTPPPAGGGDGNGGGSGTVAAALSQPATLLPRTRRAEDDTTLVSAAGRARLAASADDLGVLYEVVENQGGDSPYDCRALGAAYGSCSVANLHIKDGGGALADGGWKLYFHSIRRILRVDSDELDVARVNGDLHVITPDAGFDGFDGPVETIRLVNEFSQLMQSDLLPRYWLVRDGQAPVQVPGTEPSGTGPATDQAWAAPIEGDNRLQFNGEPAPLATPATRFEANRDTAARAGAAGAAAIQARIVPRPASMSVGNGALDVSGGISFAGTALSADSAAALARRQGAFLSTNDGTPVTASLDQTLAAGAYTLRVDAAGIAITGADQAGLFHAAQSVLALVRPGTPTIPFVTVGDAPRFAFRAMHLDVARNMHPRPTVERLLDQMAAYKLNVLHLHLSDDEGWRLEIPSLPELTAIGGRRAFQTDARGDVFEGAGLMPQLGSGAGSDNAGSGFFSRADFVALLRYATARHITVVPEFDMPGHARAAVVAMRVRAGSLGQPDSTAIRIDDPDDTSRYLTIQNYHDGILNPCLPGTYAFIGSVIDDVAAMYADAGAPLPVWHMGGDEARNIFKGAGFGPSGVTFDEGAQDFPWERSPACAAYIENTAGVNSRDDLEGHFVQRVSQLVADAGIPAMHAWMDVLDDGSAADLATERAGVNFWEIISQGDGYDRIGGYAERGFDTIVSVPDFTFFDFSQELDSAERGRYWATRFTDTAKVFAFAPENLPQNAATSVTREGTAWQATGTGAPATVTGLQGQMWSELIRSDEQVDYMVFPRLLALAERAWHRAPWEQDYAAGRTYSATEGGVDTGALADDYASFAAALGTKELAKLDAAGIRYRVPVPGALVNGGALSMNSAFPGLALEVSRNGGAFEPFSTGMTAATGDRVRARSADGQRTGREDDIE